MDRFIADTSKLSKYSFTYLKSSMDRFIARAFKDNYNNKIRFKIQYG